VLGLAGVLALGYVAQAEAVQIKVDEDTFANFGLKMKVWYQNLDERSKAKNGTSGDWRQNKFSVENTRIYFIGQVNKLVQFYGQFDQEKSNKDSTSLDEAGINFAFAKEFQVLAGKIRKSFTRTDISRSFTQLIPSSCFYDPQRDAFDKNTHIINLFTYDEKKDYGLMVHGDLAGGMFTYRIGVYNNDQRVKKNRDVQWNARVEFQPLMLGFKPESAATITAKVLDTYLGKKDILTIGLGYMSTKKPMTYR
ncbi:MAG: hypothetical protein ACP5HI_08350, partial [Caldimicrobium sp.]